MSGTCLNIWGKRTEEYQFVYLKRMAAKMDTVMAGRTDSEWRAGQSVGWKAGWTVVQMAIRIDSNSSRLCKMHTRINQHPLKNLMYYK